MNGEDLAYTVAGRAKLLYEKRNELIRECRYMDAIDELILKKGC